MYILEMKNNKNIFALNYLTLKIKSQDLLVMMIIVSEDKIYKV